jgi:hypothetical protein
LTRWLIGTGQLMTQPTTETRFTFDPRLGSTGRYRDARGRIISAPQARDILDRTLDNAADPVRELAAQLREGNIALEDWRLAMQQQIKNAHIVAAVMQRGGWDNMTQSDWGRVGQIIRTQYDYLEGFARDIMDGTQRLDGTLYRRALSYINAGRDTYNTFGRLIAMDSGYSVVGSALNPADHCAECVEYDGHWYDITTFASLNGGPERYKPPGNRECLKNCRCSEQYGRRDDDGNITEVSS